MPKKTSENPEGGAETKTDDDGVAISLYHYNDDNKLLVYLDKDKKKSRRKPRHATPGYSSMTEGNVTSEHREKAVMLAQNAPLLRRKLKTKTFRQACLLRGVDMGCLKPRSLASFKTLPNRAQELTPDEQQFHYNEYEEERLHLLGLVVSQEEASIEKTKADKAKARGQRDLMTQMFTSQIQKEREQLERMNRSRAKYERVLETENKSLHHTRAESTKHQMQNFQKTQKIYADKIATKEQLKARGQARQARIQRSVNERRKLDESRKRRQESRMCDRDARVTEFIAQKNKGAAERLAKEKAAAIKRKKRREKAKQIDKQKRENLGNAMLAKEKHIEALKMQKANALRQQKTVRAAKSRQRMSKAARVRAAKQYEKQAIIEKLHAKDQMLAELREIRKAVQQKRKDILREEIIRRDMWKARTTLERAMTPGPGAYDLPDALDLISGGAFNKSKPKSDIEWVMHRAKQTPGPGRYLNESQMTSLTNNGGGWSKYKPKSDVEWAMDRASKMPGPGQYQVKSQGPSFNTTFGNFEPKSELDFVILHANDSPAPGSHQPSMTPSKPRNLKQLTKSFGISNKAAMFAARLKSKLSKRRKSDVAKSNSETV